MINTSISGRYHVNNTVGGTKLFINKDIEEIVSFRKKLVLQYISIFYVVCSLNCRLNLFCHCIVFWCWKDMIVLPVKSQLLQVSCIRYETNFFSNTASTKYVNYMNLMRYILTSICISILNLKTYLNWNLNCREAQELSLVL